MAPRRKTTHTPPHLIEVLFQRALYLPELDLWLDPWDAKPRAFVSHAHADHFARHDSVLCSDVTSALLKARFRLSDKRRESCAFHVPIVRDGFRIRLLPAGHIPGSAMIHITRIADNATLLYTGDFKTRRSRTTESVNFLCADTLILETTFGLPLYEFPSPMEIEAEVLRFVHDTLADGATPVLLGYSLGKAQEAQALLAEHGIPVVMHPAAAAMTDACRAAGVSTLPEPVIFDGHAPAGHAVIAPPTAVRTKLLKGLVSKRTAMLSGWAMQPGAKYRYKVDTIIPFSDHADHPGLMECIQRVRPRRVLTVHGFTKEFAAELRSKDIDAWCAAGGDQLELPIQRQPPPAPPSRGPWHKRVACPLSDFSDLCRLVVETGSRTAKTKFLTSYFKELGSDDDLHTTVRWLSAEFAPKPRGKHAALLPASTLLHALASIPGVREPRVREIQRARKEPGRGARLVLQEIQLKPSAVDLAQTTAFISEFRQSSASIKRNQALSERLATLHPAEGETLVTLLSGNLELGINAILLEEAISATYPSDPGEFSEALAITGDLAETAVLARSGTLSAAQAPHPAHQSNPTATASPDTAELPFPPTETDT